MHHTSFRGDFSGCSRDVLTTRLLSHGGIASQNCLGGDIDWPWHQSLLPDTAYTTCKTYCDWCSVPKASVLYSPAILPPAGWSVSFLIDCIAYTASASLQPIQLFLSTRFFRLSSATSCFSWSFSWRSSLTSSLFASRVVSPFACL